MKDEIGFSYIWDNFFVDKIIFMNYNNKLYSLCTFLTILNHNKHLNKISFFNEITIRTNLPISIFDKITILNKMIEYTSLVVLKSNFTPILGEEKNNEF